MTLLGFRRRRSQVRGQINWFPLFLWLVLIAYWVFARNLERLDLRSTLEPWWQGWFPFSSVPQLFIVLAEMIHPRVLRHLIPPIVGWQLAHEAAINLVLVLYDLPDRPAARRFLRRLRVSTMPATLPLVVRGKTLEKERETSELLRVGGPGYIAIKAGEVAVTEINGRFHRILGPGLHLLQRLEYIHAVLDLRPQERQATDVTVITRDGIEITADLATTFRLDTGGGIASRERPYPYNEDAVRMAAYNRTVLPDGKIATWDGAPLVKAKGGLAKIIARYRLDDLLHARSAADPYHAIRTELIHQIRPALLNQGIELISLHINRLDLPEPVARQYIRYWQTHWETEIKLKEADGKAMALEETKIAQAEAEMTMIRAIIEGVQRAKEASAPFNMQELIALRLVEALDKIARESQQDVVLPLSLLPQIKELRQQLQPGEEPNTVSGANNP